jgi:hypothetical protein
MSFKDYVKQKKYEYLFEQRDEYKTGLDVCFGQLCEASLSRLWEKSKNSDFAIITAYRSKNDIKTNVQLNLELRNELNKLKLGVYPLIGHWRECQDSSIPYDECPPEQLTDVIERSYFVPRNINVIGAEEFKDLLFDLAKKYKQDGLILKVKDSDLFGVYDSKTQQPIVKFDKGITFNKVSQAYSQYVKKLKTPFVFEGIEYPDGSSLVKKAFRDKGFLW